MVGAYGFSMQEQGIRSGYFTRKLRVVSGVSSIVDEDKEGNDNNYHGYRSMTRFRMVVVAVVDSRG